MPVCLLVRYIGMRCHRIHFEAKVTWSSLIHCFSSCVKFEYGTFASKKNTCENFIVSIFIVIKTFPFLTPNSVDVNPRFVFGKGNFVFMFYTVLLFVFCLISVKFRRLRLSNYDWVSFCYRWLKRLNCQYICYSLFFFVIIHVWFSWSKCFVVVVVLICYRCPRTIGTKTSCWATK